MKKKHLLVTYGTFFLMISCQSSSHIELGTWNGFYNKTIPLKEDKSLAYTVKKISLTLKPKNQFLLIESGWPIEGEFSISNQQVILHPKLFFGKPLKQTFYNGPTTIYMEIINKKTLLLTLNHQKLSSQIELYKINYNNREKL